jgi:hypothetical protein
MSNLNDISYLFINDPNQYQLISGIPWAYSNPENSKRNWIDKVHSYFSSERNELSHLQNKLSSNLITGAKRNRIQQFVTDKNSHLKQMEKLLSEFEVKDGKPTIIDKQNILSYH